MKFFVLIFVGLFVLNAQAQEQDKTASDSRNSILEGLLSLGKSEQENCQEELKARLDKKEEIEEKIEELEKDKADDRKELQKEIDEKDADISQADVDYKKARDEVLKETNDITEEKNAQLRALNEKLTQQIQALKKIIVTDRNKIERDYNQNLKGAYGQCKIIADKDLKDRRAADRAEKQAQNAGQIKTGGAGFSGNTNKKIKAEVVKAYKECLAMAEEALKGKRTNALEESKDAEETAKSDIVNTQQELADLVKKYSQKAIELNEKLNTAAEENTQKKNSLAQQKQTLQNALHEKMTILDAQINKRKAELLNKKSTNDKNITKINKDEAVIAACCDVDDKSKPRQITAKDADNKEIKKSINDGGACKRLSRPSRKNKRDGST